MVTIREKDTGQPIGTVSDEDFDFLVNDLEEESTEDMDYFVDADTIDMLEEDGASEALVVLLRNALGDKDGLDIEWTRS